MFERITYLQILVLIAFLEIVSTFLDMGFVGLARRWELHKTGILLKPPSIYALTFQNQNYNNNCCHTFYQPLFIQKEKDPHQTTTNQILFEWQAILSMFVAW